MKSILLGIAMLLLAVVMTSLPEVGAFSSPVPPTPFQSSVYPTPTPSFFVPHVEEGTLHSQAEPETIKDCVRHTWDDSKDLWMGKYWMMVNEAGEYCIPHFGVCHECSQ